ncbi:MAG: alpha,6-mannosyltransferase [Gaiellaceae bacterium]|jgi:hypothetical protein|nr:alpha,6-mannosyltransferase [Gaiellaceae bacterium]
MRRAALAAGSGALVALVLAVVASHQAATTVHSPLRPDGAWRDVWVAGLIGAFALYAVGVGLLLRSAAPPLAVLVLAAAIQLAPLGAPLLLSTDVYSYWDYGRIAAVHGESPYDVRPSRFPGDPAYPLMGADWQGKRTVYGPVFTAASAGVAKVTGTSARAAAWSFRVLAALAMLAITALVAVGSRRPALAAAFVGWNPLLALHFAGGGHNDALMAAALATALVAVRRGSRNVEAVAWVVAASIKVVPLVLLPLRMLEARGRFGWRALVAAAAAVAIPATILFGPRWLTIFSPVANQLRSVSSLGLAAQASRIGVSTSVARNALVALFVLAWLLLAWRAWRGRARLALTSTLLLLATSWLQPWYAIWAVPLAAVEEDQVAGAIALVLCAWFLRDALPI